MTNSHMQIEVQNTATKLYTNLQVVTLHTPISFRLAYSFTNSIQCTPITHFAKPSKELP